MFQITHSYRRTHLPLSLEISKYGNIETKSYANSKSTATARGGACNV